MSVSAGQAPSMPWLLIAEGASTDADTAGRRDTEGAAGVHHKIQG